MGNMSNMGNMGNMGNMCMNPMGNMGTMGMGAMSSMGPCNMPPMGMMSNTAPVTTAGRGLMQEQDQEHAMAVIRAGGASPNATEDGHPTALSRSNPLHPAYRPPETETILGLTDCRFEGYIRLFIDDQGYGFIKCAQLTKRFPDKDVFLHRNQKGQFSQGDAVIFSVFINFRGKPQATDLRRPRTAAQGSDEYEGE